MTSPWSGRGVSSMLVVDGKEIEVAGERPSQIALGKDGNRHRGRIHRAFESFEKAGIAGGQSGL